MKAPSPFLVKPHTRVRLKDFSSDDQGTFRSKEEAAPVLVKHQGQLDQLQEVFYASQQYALLIVLQGMDGSGKDGAVRHIFSGINPQGCDVTSFKVPTPLEARHDFLWRVHAAIPPKGMIGIFNRSHYEDVLVPRAHGLLSGKEMKRRIEDINVFERTMSENHVLILKFFLHISKEEQANRLRSRLENPDKHWKLDPEDFKERHYWDDYQKVYEELLSSTSHHHAPWFIIPSDHKWYRNVVISEILAQRVRSLKLTYPRPRIDRKKFRL